jgi:hypothetical protein
MIIVTSAGTITSEENFRAMNPHTSFGAILTAAILADFGMEVLTEVPRPAYSDYFSVQPGDPVQVDGAWTQVWNRVPIPIADAQALMLGSLAAARYAAQTAPVVIDGVSIVADPHSLTMLQSAVAYLNGSTTATVNFKAASGWTDLTLIQLQAFAAAMHAQVQNAFNNEYAHTQKITALTDTFSISTYDITTGW